MLSDRALELIRDVFGDPGLFRDLPRIRKRVVLWRGSDEPLTLDHAAAVASEAGLLSALAPLAAYAEPSGAEPWSILASRPLPEGVAEHRFGARVASALAVELAPSAEPEACWIEAVDEGWLFVITHAPGSAWLLAVGGTPDALLGRSRLVAPVIAKCAESIASFPAAPRMVSPLCDEGWLACGTAAMAFDPICGDGTAHAIREAILASAVIRAAMAGEDTASLLRHYEMRLTAGFRRHLELCRQFYQPESHVEWWDRQSAAVQAGIAWCDGKLTGEIEFRMTGFDLQRIPR